MLNVNGLSDVVTVKEFAQRSGYTERAVNAWIAKGKIESTYLEGLHRRVIPSAELERVLKHGNPSDGRRKDKSTS